MRYIDLHLRYITLHYIEDSCGFQWRDVDAVTLEFPLAWHGMAWHSRFNVPLGHFGDKIFSGLA